MLQHAAAAPNPRPGTLDAYKGRPRPPEPPKQPAPAPKDGPPPKDAPAPKDAPKPEPPQR